MTPREFRLNAFDHWCIFMPCLCLAVLASLRTAWAIPVFLAGWCVASAALYGCAFREALTVARKQDGLTPLKVAVSKHVLFFRRLVAKWDDLP